MSLLMDALKRAEQAKEKGSAAQGLSLEPLADPAAAAPSDATSKPPAAEPVTSRANPGQLPSLAKLEDLDAEFIALAQQPPPQARGRAGDNTMTGRSAGQPSATRSEPAPARFGADIGAPTTQQAAVRNAFAVKEPTKSSRSAWLAIAAGTLTAVAAIGIYFWLQLRPAPGIGIATPPLAATSGRMETSAAPPLAPPPVPPVATTAAASTPTSAIKPSDSAGGDATRAIQATPAPARPETPASKVSRDGTPPAATLPQPALPMPAQNQIRFARSTDNLGRPVATDGYEAFQAGNLAGAQAAYDRSLRSDPRNADALHGRAAIALREGRIEDAEADFLRILENDPRNAEANAALVGLRGSGDPVAAESRIKSLLAQQPGAPALHFALGNLYARQSRWSEAQQAYFAALTTDGDNPDYLFNLAVSLDQLHQPRLAADYYGKALKAADARHAAFDRSVAAKRLGELTRP